MFLIHASASFPLLLSNWVYSGLAKRNRVVSPESWTGFPVGWFKYSGERDHWKGALCIKYKVVVLLLLESPTSMLFLLFHVFPHLYMLLLFELYFCRCVPKSRFRKSQLAQQAGHHSSAFHPPVLLGVQLYDVTCGCGIAIACYSYSSGGPISQLGWYHGCTHFFTFFPTHMGATFRYYRMLGVKPRGLDRFENRFGESLGPPKGQYSTPCFQRVPSGNLT